VTEIHINADQYLELEKLAVGAFAPLTGFMDEDDFTSVVDTMRLRNGAPFPLPIVLDLTPAQALAARGRPALSLVYDGIEVGEVRPTSFFSCDKLEVAAKVYGTADIAHPGVAHFFDMGEVFVGRPVTLKRRADLDISRYELLPAQTRAMFAERGWRTIVGFQTRNVPHRAHEYLQRVALEMHDGLFIQPLIGRKKAGDYSPEAIMTGYRTLVDGFYPASRVVLGVLSTAMRYAGPREAVFHAIVRRNYGCTHFIVGRDHAGVGNYYGKYDAHELTRRFDGELGIDVLRLNGPYYCRRCDGIVTEHTCPHGDTEPGAVAHIAGTDMRAALSGGARPPPQLMRPEIIDSLAGIAIFIEESDK